MADRRARGIRLLIGLVAAAALASSLAACGPSKPASTSPTTEPTTAPSTSSTAVAPTPRPTPTLDLSGTAADNMPYFRKVGHALLDRNKDAKGRTIVDYFVKAGFIKKDMEVTPDKTSIGLDAWNIEFSVRINGSCIIGQAGNVGFHSFEAPLLSTGRCLIGRTRTIDW